MFRPAEMKELRAIVPLERRDEVVRSLHEKGSVQIESVDEELTEEFELEEETTPPKFGEISSLMMDIDRDLDVLDRPPSPTSSPVDMIKDMWNTLLNPPEEEEPLEISISSREEALQKGEEIRKKIGEEIRDLDEELESIENSISTLREDIRNLKIIEKLKLENLENLKLYKYTFSTVGTFPSNSLSELEIELKESVGDALVLRSEPIDEEREVLAVWTMAENKDKTLSKLNQLGFNEITPPASEGKPEKVREELKQKLEEKKTKQKEIFRKIEEISRKHKKEMLATREVLNIEKERTKVVNNFSKTETAVIIQGWVPEEETKEVDETVKEITDGACHLNFEEPEEEPPTLLNNPPILKDFEFLTKLFGVPSHQEIDPTPLLAITYLIFFGLMFTDVGYGAITLVMAIAMFRGGKIPIVNIGGKTFSKILILASITTIVTGLIMGSYFGDLTNYIGIGDISLYNPITNPLPLLLFCIYVGILHEYIGVGIGLWGKIKQKEWKEVVGDRICWLFFLTALTLFVINPNFEEWLSFGSTIARIGWLLIGISVVMTIYGQGLIGIMDIFSMFGNVLSYTRILALALVTSALALTFNQIASMIWGAPVIGVVIGALFFLGGHLFSWIINLISSFVHSLRLHYVEFFDKFFEGRGKSFRPFQMKRRYTKVKN